MKLTRSFGLRLELAEAELDKPRVLVHDFDIAEPEERDLRVKKADERAVALQALASISRQQRNTARQLQFSSKQEGELRTNQVAAEQRKDPLRGALRVDILIVTWFGFRACKRAE